jgi:Uma2 family endonuclease
MTAFTLNLNPLLKLTTEQFYQLCVENRDLKLELNAQGHPIVIPPTGGETGRSNASLILQIGLWNQQNQLGEVFDSSTGFTLPNGANRSPDVSWIEKSRWDALSKSEKEKFIPLYPNFVIEIMSPSDTLKEVREKMKEYMENGCLLGWLINRKKQEVEIYRLGREVEVLQSPQTMSGENVLPSLVVNLSQIWS